MKLGENIQVVPGLPKGLEGLKEGLIHFNKAQTKEADKERKTSMLAQVENNIDHIVLKTQPGNKKGCS